jgi:hypothetical protein
MEGSEMLFSEGSQLNTSLILISRGLTGSHSTAEKISCQLDYTGAPTKDAGLLFGYFIFQI